jgi:hypothetical protein
MGVNRTVQVRGPRLEGLSGKKAAKDTELAAA